MDRDDLQKNLSVVEAAVRIGVSPFTMRTWLRQRRIPFIRAGRRILLSPEDIERFLAANRVEAKSASPS